MEEAVEHGGDGGAVAEQLSRVVKKLVEAQVLLNKADSSFY